MRFRIALTIAILLVAFQCGAQNRPFDVRALKPHETLTRELRGGETHAYKINLKAGQFLHVIIQQRNVDVVVGFTGPDGKQLVEVNSPNGAEGREPLFWIAKSTGRHQLEVRAAEKEAVGYYDVKIVEVRLSSEIDEKRVVAQQAFVEATRLAGQQDSEARQTQIRKYMEALPLWQESGEVERHFLTLNVIAGGYLYAGEPLQTLKYLLQALSLAREVGDRIGEAATLISIGSLYDQVGERQTALEYYNQVLPIVRATGDRAVEATILHDIGNIYYLLGEPKQSLDHYNEALSIERLLGDRVEEAKTLISQGLVYYSLGEKELALKNYNQALPVFKELGHREGEAATLRNIGRLYSSRGEKQQALELFNQALAIFTAIGDLSGQAATLNNIGMTYQDLDEYGKALEYYRQTLPLLTDRGNEANTLNNIGSVYSAMGEKQKALEYYNQAVPALRAAGDRRGESSTLNNIGAVYFFLGEHQKALEFYNQALPLRKIAGDRNGEATTLNNIGAVYGGLGEDQKALDYYNQALPIYRSIGDRDGEASTLRNIGQTYDDLGQKQKALENYNQALQVQRAIGDRTGEAGTLNSIGKVYSDLDQKQKALEYYNQALPIQRAVGDRSGEATTLHNLGSFYHETGEWKKAVEYYNQGLPMLRAIGNLTGEAATLGNLMWLWKKDNPNLAVLYGKQCINVYQKLRGNIKGLDKGIQKTYVHSVEDNYRSLADLLIELGRLPEAQHVLELLKEQEYFEFVRRDVEAGSLRGAQIRFNATEAEIEKRFSQISGQVAELAAQRTELLALDARSAEQETRLSELEAKLETANQAFQKFLDQLDVELKKTSPGKNDVTALRETQSLMDTLRELDGVALYTIVGQDKYRVILITADVQKAYEYPIAEADLNKKIHAFREMLQDPTLDPLLQAQELYRILIGPELARDIGQTKMQTILWSLDGTLRYLPVAALHDGKRYLVERYRNVVFTLASRDHLKDPVSPKWQALGVGVSREREVIDETSKESLRFAALPGVRDELTGIVRQQTDGAAGQGVLDGKVMLDEAFTAEALRTSLRLRGSEQPYKLVHIASHFNFQPGDETKSFLLLGDGTLTLARLKGMTNLFSKVELLTLSACNTATGGAGEGKEVEGFAVLAQRQGAEAIIATLWPVSDPSTSQLMRQFYRLREARAGTSKAEALRQAQLELLHGDAKANPSSKDQRAKLAAASAAKSSGRPFSPDPQRPFAHPYYWAPFILIGNWR